MKMTRHGGGCAGIIISSGNGQHSSGVIGYIILMLITQLLGTNTFTTYATNGYLVLVLNTNHTT